MQNITLLLLLIAIYFSDRASKHDIWRSEVWLKLKIYPFQYQPLTQFRFETPLKTSLPLQMNDLCQYSLHDYFQKLEFQFLE